MFLDYSTKESVMPDGGNGAVQPLWS
jgi:hypothetical protein